MMNRTDSMKALDDILDIEAPSEEVIEGDFEVLEPSEAPLPAIPANDSQDIDAEYKYAQDNLHNVIDKGSAALEEMIMIAKQSEQPRAFEVVGSLMKVLADTNKDLLELKSKQQSLKGEKASAGPKSVTNAVFVGSTKELQKMIKDMNNGDGK